MIITAAHIEAAERYIAMSAIAFNDEGPPGVTEYWLHIRFARKDTKNAFVMRKHTEEIYNKKPRGLKAFHVWVSDGIEYTATNERISIEGQWCAVAPYGNGWRRLKEAPPDFMGLKPYSAAVWWRKGVRHEP